MSTDADLWYLDAALADTLVAQARAARPREACGLLLAAGTTIVRLQATANVDPDPTRYTIAPEEHFAALRAARRDGLEVVGAYHSHPAGAPVPSATDRLEAAGDFLYLIVGLTPEPALGAWRLVDGNFVPVRLVRT